MRVGGFIFIELGCLRHFIQSSFSRHSRITHIFFTAKTCRTRTTITITTTTTTITTVSNIQNFNVYLSHNNSNYHYNLILRANTPTLNPHSKQISVYSHVCGPVLPLLNQACSTYFEVILKLSKTQGFDMENEANYRFIPITFAL